MPFQPGQSGNPSGRPQSKPWSDAIKRALARAENDPALAAKTLNRLAERLLENCAEGDLSALKELGDRLEGKPVTIHGGDTENPIKLEISWATS